MVSAVVSDEVSSCSVACCGAAARCPRRREPQPMLAPVVGPEQLAAATATAQTATAIRAVSAPMPPPQPAMRHTKHADTLIDTAIGDDVNLNCNGQLETADPAPAFAAGDCAAAAREHPATSPLRPPAEPPPPP